MCTHSNYIKCVILFWVVEAHSWFSTWPILKYRISYSESSTA